MNVLVRGKNCKVPADLRDAAAEKLERAIRLARRVQRVEVELSEHGPHHSPPGVACEITVRMPRHVVRARAEASEPSSALDLAVAKVGQQLARIKGKRVTRGRRHARAGRGTRPAASQERSVGDGEHGDGLAWDPSLDAEGEEDGALHIVREKRFDTKPMTPEEAALQMDLLGHDFFLFPNSENGNAAVIYRRRDGDLGLIETPG